MTRIVQPHPFGKIKEIQQNGGVVAATSLQDVQQAARLADVPLFPRHGGAGARRGRAAGRDRAGPAGPWLSRLDGIAGLRAWRDYLVSIMRRRQ